MVQRKEGNKIYANFASVYDFLMTDIPYDAWVQYLQKLFRYFKVKPGRILDLGCGTGNISIPLASLGFSVTGVDMSLEMLSLAEQKTREHEVEVVFLCQDMRELNIPDSFDMVISMVDSFNYLVQDEDVEKTLASIGRVLEVGGLLIFDLNSDYKIRNVFNNNTYTLIEDQVCYIWENRYDPATSSCEMEVTFFVENQQGCYERFTELHRERAFCLEEIEEFLTHAGFKLEAVFGELTLEEPTAAEERIFIIAKKL